VMIVVPAKVVVTTAAAIPWELQHLSGYCTMSRWSNLKLLSALPRWRGRPTAGDKEITACDVTWLT
jgi:hypothetical protein